MSAGKREERGMVKRAGRVAMTQRAVKSGGAVVLLLGMLLGVGVSAQVANPQYPELSPPGPHKERSAEDALSAEQKQQLAKKQNEVRQQELKRDTDRLFELATELKQYVDKTNENILSMEVIKKAEQIEKLAKSVKEKMKGQ